MAEVQLDVATANRFISSLSKSLQALCHGCMDFDAGIEIVGYLNINIDSGSKVDYVLNEKVLKSSTTNSMTFVSNSFLAKKDQPKHLTDGSCSPIPELNYPQHKARGGYPYPATQQYRSSGIFSPHSQVLRGSQKRAWAGGDWRTSPRKYPRGAKSQYGSYQHQSSSQSDSYSYSNQTPADPSLSSSSYQQSTFTSQDYENSGTQIEVNVKKEPEESCNQDPSGGDSTNQNCALPDNVNIKTDPDSIPNTDGGSNENSDMSNSFLLPTKTDETSEINPNNTGENQENPETKYEDSSFNAEEQSAAEDPENPEMSHTNEDSQGMSADADYEGSGEMYPQSSYAGEGSSSGGGQFEVIEIDDEDEDVAAMFDESPYDSSSKIQSLQSPLLASSLTVGCEKDDIHKDSIQQHTKYFCKICKLAFAIAQLYVKHMNDYHQEAGLLPYTCTVCCRGFLSSNGLAQHMSLHGGQEFNCFVCGARFKHKSSFRRHVDTIHEFKQCRYCEAMLKKGVEFNQHILSCCSNK